MIDKATLWAFMKEFVYASIKSIMMKYGAYEPNNRQTWENISARANEFHLQFFWKVNEADNVTVAEFDLYPDGLTTTEVDVQ